MQPFSFESLPQNPSPDAIKKLRDILNVGGSGIVEIIWGPELELEDINREN